MALTVNLRHLEDHDVELKGELTPAELDMEIQDEVIRIERPLEYDIEVQKVEEGLLAQGQISVVLDCTCVRCLKQFQHRLALDTWAVHLPLEGEEPVPVINDCVDLTRVIREDILLEFPQHPLCDPECRGLPKTTVGKAKKASGKDEANGDSPVWSELNKLKF